MIEDKYKPRIFIRSNIKHVNTDNLLYYLKRLPRYIVLDVYDLIHRAIYGWSKSDAWNCDLYIARVAIGIITHHKNTKVSVPCGFTFGEWDRELVKMIDGFKASIELIDSKSIDDDSVLIDKMNTGLSVFVKHFRSLWD